MHLICFVKEQDALLIVFSFCELRVNMRSCGNNALVFIFYYICFCSIIGLEKKNCVCLRSHGRSENYETT